MIPHQTGVCFAAPSGVVPSAVGEVPGLETGAARSLKTGTSTRSLRLGEEDTAILNRLMAETGFGANEVVRRCLRAVGEGDPIDRDSVLRVEEQLRKIGTNLNQIARRYNSGQVVVADEMAGALVGVVQVLDSTSTSLRAMTRAARDLYRSRAGSSAP